jgi:hypothetical protein
MARGRLSIVLMRPALPPADLLFHLRQVLSALLYLADDSLGLRMLRVLEQKFFRDFVHTRQSTLIQSEL